MVGNAACRGRNRIRITMKQLGKVLNKTSWAQASNTINTNSESVFSAVTMLENAAFKHKGYFLTSEEVEQLYPSAEEGSQAFVYNSSNPSTAPYDIYQMIGGTWVDTGLNGGSVSVDLTKKQDTLVGYSESVSEGKATQVAIQGDTIALSGKVSLGNVDNMESAILMSSSQAGAAIAKANTLEQSMSALKSPVKPIHLNSQGKLELNIGKGLYIEDGKLCTTGASGGGGGGTTLSEGVGISILNNKISVAYNTKTLGIDSCGGLTVNYGEGLTIKNGKLSAQASVNAGNGLVKKGDALQVSVGTGLLVADDVYVNMGKGLATDNENKVNVNLDEQTLTTDACGKVIVNKDSLIGNGLKQEYSKLAVNYGTGLSVSGGKLYSTVQSKTYVSGHAINVNNNNEINVKYDGVTISTKDTADNSLHVMLGSGLAQGTSGIGVAVGSGLAIGEDNKLYSTVSSGKTYTAGDGISISGDKISAKCNDGIKIACGYLAIATGDGLHIKNDTLAINTSDGLGFTTDGLLKLKLHEKSGLQATSAGLGVNVGVALSTSDGKLNVQYGTGLGKSTDNKLQVLLGTGLAVEGNYIRVEEAVYDSIEEANAGVSRAHEVVTKLQTALGGKQNTLTLATGLEWGKTDMIQVKMNAPLHYDNCGRLMLNYDSTLTVSDYKLRVNPYGIIDNEGGLTYNNKGLGVNVGRGLKIESCQVVVDYGTGLKVVNNKLDVDTSKIAGVGIDLDSDYKMLTIGTKAAQALAGTGLMPDGPRMKVKYGSGLTTNTCGKLIVDAENLTVGNADMLSGRKLGYANGTVPLYVPFPTFDPLISMGYLRSDYQSSGYPTEDFLKAICKWAIATYPNSGEILMGRATPSDSGFLILSMYSSYGYDATTLLPKYCTGWYMSLTGKSFRFYTVNYVWYMREVASLDSTVAKATTADKATADANGNKITETYARRFMPTNGLEINSDRELFLPNLTASVINGAADGSKNGAQRVLNLSCGAIQIKLSTGLAIDEEGYLYIQDK